MIRKNSQVIPMHTNETIESLISKNRLNNNLSSKSNYFQKQLKQVRQNSI